MTTPSQMGQIFSEFFPMAIINIRRVFMDVSRLPSDAELVRHMIIKMWFVAQCMVRTM